LKKEKLKLFYGGLFHDIGKVVQRASGERKKHAILGADWFEKYSDDKEISQQIRYHMANYQADLEDSHLAYITYLADNIASGVDRRNSLEEADEHQSEGIWDTYTNQEDIFNVFGQNRSKRYFEPRELNVKEPPNIADESRMKFSKGDYAGILRRIEDSISLMTFDEEYINSALNLAEATLSFVPASTNTKEIADISLYEHSKLTAGFACAIYDYLSAVNRTNFKKELFHNGQDFYKEEAFLLVSFDVSGIQDFIYNIATKGAAKQLKARSLFLDFMSEHISDSLLEELDLTRANLMYLGGGHAYFVFANTEKIKKQVSDFEKKFNQFLLKHFQTRLYVAFGWSAFAANDIMSHTSSLATYRKIYQQASHQISRKKLSRYDWQTIALLNQGGKKVGRECQICHSVDQLTEADQQTLCHLCDSLRKFAKQIQGKHFLISSDEDGLPVGPNAYLSTITENEIKAGVQGRVYTKNDFYTGNAVSTHIFIGDYRFAEIDQYASLATQYQQANGKAAGIKRLGVVRLDVDNLGAGFMAGFSHQANGQYNTFSRSATFSRSMSQFFKIYINYFAQDKKISIIYSGGDDVFAVGTWQDILLFTIELRQQFVNWTNHKLTLSAGIGLFPDKTPVSMMARLTGSLEEAAKNNEHHDKDSIAVFDENFVFAFDEFINEVYEGKLPIIRYFFNQQDERGKGFAYRLLELIRSQEKLDIARLAYYLSRMEDLVHESKKQRFREFKQEFFSWANGGAEVRKQAELALMLYIYEIRKDK
jgi:CRISPR-associated protein Csm1